MRVRTYRASTLQEALRAMRRELGEDAVILDTRTLRSEGADELIEVIATTDQELAAAPGNGASPDALTLVHLHHEVAELRHQIARLEFALRCTPGADFRWQQLYDQLRSEGFTEEYLQQRIPPTEPFPSWKEALARARHRLTEALQIAPLPQPADTPTRIAVIGCPGAGKTTTLLKLLLHYKLTAAVPTEFIIAGPSLTGIPEQLALLASIADIPVTEAYGLPELRRALLQQSAGSIIGIEIPGGNPFAAETQQLWQHYRELIRPEAFYAVVSATDSLSVLRRLCHVWTDMQVTGLVVTKLDIAPAIGPLVQALAEYSLPVVCLCAGPRIPDDMEPATVEALACRIGVNVQQ